MMRILFVDDLPDTRHVFRLAFGLYGHSTRLAGNGREAVEAVQAEKFDAIVMDVEMPEMNGWDAVRAIRALPDCRNTPIVMFTAYGNGGNRRQAHDVGADSLLHKPTTPQEVLDEIERLAARKGL
jgi:CheY-like chemotaxis protein